MAKSECDLLDEPASGKNGFSGEAVARQAVADSVKGTPADKHAWEHTAEGDHLFCPFNATLDLLTGRWTLHILRSLLSGPKRFNEIAQQNGINAHTLRERLRALEEEEVVTRTVISTMPPNVEYGLTEKGYALNGVFEEIAAWGRRFMKPPEKTAGG